MATKFNLIGVSKIDIGDVDATELNSYGDILENSVTFDLVNDSMTDINLEDSTDPFISIFGSKAKSVEFTLLGLSLSDAENYMGGTFVAGSGGTKDTWTEPESQPYIFQQLKIYTKNKEGDEIALSFPEVQVIASLSEAPTKSAVAGVHFKMMKNAPMVIEGATVEA